MVSPEPSRYPAAGEVIDGKYRIERMLGEGGMGAVAAATHLLLRAPVALKFISPDVVRVPGVVDRFMNEGAVAMRIDSEHVVRVLDVGRLPNGLPFLVMEFLEGCDLSELLEREGATAGLSITRAVHFVVQILRALQAAHGAGVIHRDLKPSNCYVVARDDEAEFIKLLDFGISKSVADGTTDKKLTQTNTGLGTPLYMSPEQARNAREATPRSDLYSVAAILFELLTGHTPYDADSPNDLLFKLFTAEPTPIQSLRPDVPDELASIVHRGLSKNAEDRPASAVEFAELLSPFAEERAAALIARMRNTAGGRLSALPGDRATFAPTSKKSVEFDRTIAATPTLSVAPQSVVVAKTAGVSPNAATSLNMGISGAGDAAQTSTGGSRTPMMAGIFGGVVIAALGIGFVVSGSKTNVNQPNRDPVPVVTGSVTTSSAAVATSAAPIEPATTAPSASVAATASASAASSATTKATTTTKPPPTSQGGGKKDPFGAGLQQ